MITQTLPADMDWKKPASGSSVTTLAYATRTDPQLLYFGDGSGYIAFRNYWGYTYVLGDP